PSSFISISAFSLHFNLHSFPTRRSSDLLEVPASPPGSGGFLSLLFCVRAIGLFYRHDGISLQLDPKQRGRQLDGKTCCGPQPIIDRKSTRLNSSHVSISYAVFCLKKTTV